MIVHSSFLCLRENTSRMKSRNLLHHKICGQIFSTKFMFITNCACKFRTLAKSLLATKLTLSILYKNTHGKWHGALYGPTTTTCIILYYQLLDAWESVLTYQFRSSMDSYYAYCINASLTTSSATGRSGGTAWSTSVGTAGARRGTSPWARTRAADSTTTWWTRRQFSPARSSPPCVAHVKQ